MFTWAKLALTLAQLLSFVMTWLRERQLITQGEQKAVADILLQEIQLSHTAEEIRKRLDDDFRRNSDGVMRHDKYERT